ncbi:hypothetical protein RRF57_009796 [Xylaria bambusicola]|uniref:Uncharacterized protein n=1 Tax=Xylaria bambusicola TaxID=326684 RepID=A0AAN7Z838_9PEZI
MKNININPHRAKPSLLQQPQSGYLFSIAKPGHLCPHHQQMGVRMGSRKSSSQNTDPSADSIQRFSVSLKAMLPSEDFEYICQVSQLARGLATDPEFDTKLSSDQDADSMDRTMVDDDGNGNCGEEMSNAGEDDSNPQFLQFMQHVMKVLNSDLDSDTDEIAKSHKMSPTCPSSYIQHKDKIQKTNSMSFTGLRELKFHVDKVRESYSQTLGRNTRRMEQLVSMRKEIEKARIEEEELKLTFDRLADQFAKDTDEMQISMELWKEYQVFCEDLDRRMKQFVEHDLPGTWFFKCEKSHGGSYVKYDDQFILLKKHADYWGEQNFRCEALIEREATSSNPPMGYAVRIKSFKYPETSTESAITWGELYPKLYQQAYLSATLRSRGAKAMLVALPDHHASSKGGWLFEYICSHIRSKLAVLVTSKPGSTRTSLDCREWFYHSAHNLAKPETMTDKLKRIERELSNKRGREAKSRTALLAEGPDKGRYL